MNEVEGGMDLISYIPEGVSVTAVIVTVIAFLKHQAKQAELHEAQLDRIVGQFRESLTHISNNHDRSIEQVGAKMETHTQVTSSMNENLVRLISKIEEKHSKV